MLFVDELNSCESVDKLATRRHESGGKAHLGSGIEIFLRIVEEKRLLGLYTKMLYCILKNRAVGLGKVRLEGSDTAIEVVSHLAPLGTEALGDF